MRRFHFRLELICLLILSSFLLNLILSKYFHHCTSSLDARESSLFSSQTGELGKDFISTIERSQRALNKLKSLLDIVKSPEDSSWIWNPSDQYPSVPYQPASFFNRTVPKSLSNRSALPKVITDEIDRVCQRLQRANVIGGQIWCQLFNKSYSETLATTVTLLDDNSTYIITGDIDLMWLRDSSAQVHHYLPLWKDVEIQRIIEGLLRRQTKFIFSNPYGSAFRLTLRPNPPSDDSLQPLHVQKGRNLHVAMHNYELDSLCYHLRLSYSWWKQTQLRDVFNDQWLIGVTMIVQVMIIEQHHSQISPYRYTELPNDYQGFPVAYTGMTWSGFRPSDDRTKYGYLIPSNMMATVVLQQLSEMIQVLYPNALELLKQIYQLRADILAGINTFGVVQHANFGRIYAFETDGFANSLLIDDANVPSLLSAPYLNFQTPFDPDGRIINATRRFVLSKNNPLFFEGRFASGIGSEHTESGFVWPMAIIMEGFTINEQEKSNRNFDFVWQRLETSHANTFSMHESFDVNDPSKFTRRWFAWVNSLFAELILSRLESLEDWLHHRRST